jgi:hypothetical protein
MSGLELLLSESIRLAENHADISVETAKAATGAGPGLALQRYNIESLSRRDALC